MANKENSIKALLVFYKKRQEAKRIFEDFDTILANFVELHGIGDHFQDPDTNEVYEITPQYWKAVRMQTATMKQMSKKRAKELGYSI